MKTKDDLETSRVKPRIIDQSIEPQGGGDGGRGRAGDNLGILVCWFDLGSSVNENNFIHFHLHILTSGG